MWEYHGIDHNNDFLQHWKYTSAEESRYCAQSHGIPTY